MKHSILLLLIIITIFSTGCIKKSTNITNNDNNINCVSEPRDIAYYEQCCDNLKTIWGFEKPDGTCECSGENTKCDGANTCAPCGNNKCEAEYKEDKCSCPEDCK